MAAGISGRLCSTHHSAAEKISVLLKTSQVEENALASLKMKYKVPLVSTTKETQFTFTGIRVEAEIPERKYHDPEMEQNVQFTQQSSDTFGGRLYR